MDHVGERRYALIIGINDYTDGAIPDLKTCESSARALYDLLTDLQSGGVHPRNATLLDHHRQSEWAARNLVRDYALFASAGACLILSIPLAWWMLRSGPSRGDLPPVT